MSRSGVPIWRRCEAASSLVRSPHPARCDGRTGSCGRGKKRADVPHFDRAGGGVEGDDSAPTATPVTSSGLFVASNTILAALSTSEWLMSSWDHQNFSALSFAEGPLMGVVITAEAGGWLRVREQRNGSIRYQRRLHSESDPSCMCWAGMFPSFDFFVGQQCGRVTMMRLLGESITKVADCVLHEVAVVAMARVSLRGTTDSTTVGTERTRDTTQEVLLTLDAGGVLAMWGVTNLQCLHTVRLRHSPVRCLLSDRSLPGCVFVPSGIVQVLTAPGTDDKRGLFDVVLARCPFGAETTWETVVTYGGAEAAVISMSLAPRNGSTGRTEQALWGGTESGALHMWDVIGGTPLRVVRRATPACSPVHHLMCASRVDPQHVWVCTRGGGVALWDAARLVMVTELPVSYPRGPAAGNCSSKKGRHGDGADTHFLQHLVKDTSEVPSHFTLFVGPIEPVLTLRLWSASTDGSVRSWLCQTALSDIFHREAPSRFSSSHDISDKKTRTNVGFNHNDDDVDINAAVLDKDTVRLFIETKARLFVEETASLRSDVLRLTHDNEALQARNRLLTTALNAAIARIAGNDDAAKEEPLVTSPLPSSQSQRCPFEGTSVATPTETVLNALGDLRRRLQDSFEEKERLAADKMALRLQLSGQLPPLDVTCEERAAPLATIVGHHEVVAQQELNEVERLREELAACQATSKMYMGRWREQEVRREAVEQECEMYRKQLVALREELRHTRALLSTPTGDHSWALEKASGSYVVTSTGINKKQALEQPVFFCDVLGKNIVNATSGRGLEEEQMECSQEEADNKVVWLDRARQSLWEKEVFLLRQAERLCALEEELRRKESRLMRLRRDSQ